MLWSLLLVELCQRCCHLATCFFDRRCNIRIWL